MDKLLTKTSDLEQGISAANHELKRMNSYFAKLLIQGQE
jgi:hypothetical protein